ncbi:MAG: transposase [Lachnospiraceae bacterium]
MATCKNCPYHGQCHPKEHKRVATIKIAMRKAFHARQQRFLKTEEFKTLAHFRNGIETVPKRQDFQYGRESCNLNR